MAENPKSVKPAASGSGLQAAISNAGLMRSLASESPEIRQAAIQTALRMRDANAIEPLLFILQSKDATARMDAARALPLVHAKNSVPQISALLTHQDPFVRAAIGRTLGKWGFREAIPALIRAM